MIRPKYPKDSLHKGAQGTVELRAIIAPNGKIKDLVVLSGEPQFSQPALDAIRKWRFHPEKREGHPVETAFKIQVRFNLVLREANSDVELESPQPEPLATLLPTAIQQTDLGPDVHRVSEGGVIAPKQIYAPEPEFSEEDRKEKHQGNVGIALVVGADGLPRDLKIICSSIPRSNGNAIEAVKQWKFSPAIKDGKPVAVPIEVEVTFHLY
jgi:TonB family protein